MLGCTGLTQVIGWRLPGLRLGWSSWSPWLSWGCLSSSWSASWSEVCASVLDVLPVRNSDSQVIIRMFSEALRKTIEICTFSDIYLVEELVLNKFVINFN